KDSKPTNKFKNHCLNIQFQWLPILFYLLSKDVIHHYYSKSNTICKYYFAKIYTKFTNLFSVIQKILPLLTTVIKHQTENLSWIKWLYIFDFSTAKKMDLLGVNFVIITNS